MKPISLALILAICALASSAATAPPGIVYSASLPDSTAGATSVTAVVTDLAGNTWVGGGIIGSGLHATPGAFQPQFAGGGGVEGSSRAVPRLDAFIAKFDAHRQLVFVTYLGGV